LIHSIPRLSTGQFTKSITLKNNNIKLHGVS
jgi:hypothetical protein